MATPAATLTNVTATGDIITGPGVVVNLVNGLPQACMGDVVTGAVCVGAISMTTAPNYLVKGRPAANIGSAVTGVNPITGVPVVTAVAVATGINKIE